MLFSGNIHICRLLLTFFVVYFRIFFLYVIASGGTECFVTSRALFAGSGGMTQYYVTVGCSWSSVPFKGQFHCGLTGAIYLYEPLITVF